MINLSDIARYIGLIKEKTDSLEPGDLMQIYEVKGCYDKLLEEISYYPELENLSRFVKLLSKLNLMLLKSGQIDQIKSILCESNENLYLLFSKKKPKKEVAANLNQILLRLKEMIRTQRGESEGIGAYPDNYFANIVDDKKMLAQLSEEIKEHLNEAQYTLIELEYDETNQENINKIFRDFHTIKGSSSFLGVRNVEEVAHSIEDLLVLVRDGKIKVNKELIDIIFYGIELLRDLTLIMDTYNYNIEKVVESFKKVNIFNYVRLIGKILKEYSERKIGEILQEEGKLNPAEVKEILQRQVAEDKKFGEIALEKKLISHEDLKQAIIKQTALKRPGLYVKVSNERLNMLVDIVGELVIVQSMLQQLLKEGMSAMNYERLVNQHEVITRNIKNLVLSMGMVPIAEIFNKLRVVIRNTARELNKAVVAEFSGENTELDRNIIEAIYEPLVHIVRNSIDHGIEPVEERENLKKDRIGKIVVSAEQHGDGIEISVYDDGAGIDKERIVRKAIQMGLLEEEKALIVSDKEIYNFIFMAGFSTSQKTTEVSGRGVGLDVVKKNIEKIHGKVEIDSERGKYTCFIIKLPLTLAIIEGLVTIIGRNKYIFPFHAVDEIVVPESRNIKSAERGGLMLVHREGFIPVIISGKILGEKDYESKVEDSLLVILRYEKQKYGIMVDEVIGKQEVVMKNMGDVLSGSSYFSGGTIFGDGTIGVIINTEAFIETAKNVS